MSRFLVWLLLFALAALGATALLGPRGTLLAVVCCGASYFIGRHLTVRELRAEKLERNLQKSVVRVQSEGVASALRHADAAARLGRAAREDLERQAPA